MRRFAQLGLVACLLATTIAATATAMQYAVRVDDPLGLSIRTPRVRIPHSTVAQPPGSSMYLQATDPWMFYARGRDYFFREWGGDDGVFAALPNRPEAATANSCGICHNLPFPSAGSGGNVGIRVGVGRTAPHLFGSGLIETLGVQIRADILAAHDRNRNGYLDVPSETQGRRAIVTAAPGVTLDFGALDDQDGDGHPDLNPVLMVRMVDGDGERLFFDRNGSVPSLRTPGIVGYDLAAGVFSSSAGDHQFPSLRTFSTGVFTTIMGIVPEAAVTPISPRRFTPGNLLPNWGKLTNAGAFQSEVVLIGDAATETGRRARPTISEGELDALEWFQMNHPAPAIDRPTSETRRGRQLMDRFGCTSCHLPSWTIGPADDTGRPGDRRFFDLQVRFNETADRLEARLTDLTRVSVAADGTQTRQPRREGFVVEHVFTDLRHHDLGPRFWEYDYLNGQTYVTRAFRTAPLWGVGASGPYGHDGRSLTLDDVIRRHGGEAATAANAYRAAAVADRKAVIAFLSSLTLYQPDLLPTDINGDGRIDTDLQRDGQAMGPEVLRPELLFRTAPRYRGWVTDADGRRYFSYELLNAREAYGETLEGLRDADRDSWPDAGQAIPSARIR